MTNKQKFKRTQLLVLIGQADSPRLTITKINRDIEQGEVGEKVIKFSYECTYWSKKNNKFYTIEEALMKAPPV